MGSIYKILIVGESGCGKTSVLNRLVGGEFTYNNVSTVGVDFQTKNISFDGKEVTMQIWDTAGQEKYQNITQSYFRNSHGIIVAYDITDSDSFKRVKHWVDKIRSDFERIPILLIGNKADLQDKRVVSKENAEALAKSLNVKYLETSALDYTNIDETFIEMARTLYKHYSENPQTKPKGAVSLNHDSSENTGYGCC